VVGVTPVVDGGQSALGLENQGGTLTGERVASRKRAQKTVHVVPIFCVSLHTRWLGNSHLELPLQVKGTLRSEWPIYVSVLSPATTTYRFSLHTDQNKIFSRLPLVLFIQSGNHTSS